MLQFLSEVGGVSRKYISDLSIQDKRSFFTLDQKHSSEFADRFIGLETDNGHQIRVNIEHNGKDRSKRNKGGKGKKRDSYRDHKRGRKGRFKSRK